MRQFQTTIHTNTESYGMHNISAIVQDAVSKSGITVGMCTIFIRHTSASLVIQENADASVCDDLKSFMSQLAPQGGKYRHTDEGPDDMPSHIRSAVTRTSESVPVSAGKLVLGRWQGIFVWEHRETPHKREMVLHIVGE
jgi:secondary thiamine-phosphate synthase enzyme